VTGSGFSGATAVNFGSLVATSFSVTSATTLTAVSPAVAGASAVVEPNWGVRRLKGPYPITPAQLVRLEGFEPPTLGSVGTFHSQQLGDFLKKIPQLTRSQFTRVQGCSTR